MSEPVLFTELGCRVGNLWSPAQHRGKGTSGMETASLSLHPLFHRGTQQRATDLGSAPDINTYSKIQGSVLETSDKCLSLGAPGSISAPGQRLGKKGTLWGQMRRERAWCGKWKVAWAECELEAEWEEGWRGARKGDGSKEKKFRNIFSRFEENVMTGRTW